MIGEEWRGAVGEAWASDWRRTDRSFAGLDPHLNAAIAGAAVDATAALDVGCGAGATSLALAAARPDLAITGVDLSADLVAVATERVESTRATFRVGDAAAEAAAIAPDLLFSRHGVMFFADPATSFAALAAAARPGARLVFSCFADRADNLWASEPAKALAAPPPADPLAPGPFAFADPERVAALLAATGWTDAHPIRVTYDYVAGGGPDPVGDAVDFFSRIGPAAPLLREGGEAAVRALATVCRGYLVGDVIAFPAAVWVWSAIRKERA